MVRLRAGGLLAAVAVFPVLVVPAGADGCLCEDEGFWGLSACIADRTLGFGKDVGWHMATTLAPEGVGPVASRCSEAARWANGVVRNAAWSCWESLRSTSAAGGARSYAAAAGQWGAEAFRATPAYGPVRSLGAVALEAVDRWRESFAQAFPEHAALVADRASLLYSAVWLLSAVGIACYGASWLVGTLCCFRRRRAQSDIMFFPDPSGRQVARICHELAAAKTRLWLAIFLLTDDALASEVLKAHARKVDVRIIADDDQYRNAIGSDVQRLAESGVPVLLDNSTANMHHKFVVIDDIVMSGSFNWTKQASVANCENLCIMRDSATVEAFVGEFRRLWSQFSKRGRRAGRPSSPCDRPRASRPRDRTPPARGGG